MLPCPPNGTPLDLATHIHPNPHEPHYMFKIPHIDGFIPFFPPLRQIHYSSMHHGPEGSNSPFIFDHLKDDFLTGESISRYILFGSSLPRPASSPRKPESVQSYLKMMGRTAYFRRHRIEQRMTGPSYLYLFPSCGEMYGDGDYGSVGQLGQGFAAGKLIGGSQAGPQHSLVGGTWDPRSEKHQWLMYTFVRSPPSNISDVIPHNAAPSTSPSSRTANSSISLNEGEMELVWRGFGHREFAHFILCPGSGRAIGVRNKGPHGETEEGCIWVDFLEYV